MKIKICGLTGLVNIRDILDLNPDYIGFIFHPSSPRYMVDKISPHDIFSICSDTKKAGVFVNSGFHAISTIYLKYNLDIVQLHGEESPQLCKQLKSSGIEIMKAFRMKAGFNFRSIADYIPYCRYFLFDTYADVKGGSGKKFDWEIIANYDLGHPFFLSGGITPYDAEEIFRIDHPSLVGVDLNSRFEDSPGIKNISKLKIFLNELRGQKI
ncbi:MAG: phosphoribosylanthranilate isomerase [Bacteroidota bacterium]